MLIRSQNKESLLNTKTISAFNIFESENDFRISAESLDYSCTIGIYSSRKKAVKVLDMIQESYINCTLTEHIIPEIASVVKNMPNTTQNEVLTEIIGNTLSNKMLFQMPKSSEVEV